MLPTDTSLAVFTLESKMKWQKNHERQHHENGMLGKSEGRPLPRLPSGLHSGKSDRRARRPLEIGVSPAWTLKVELLQRVCSLCCPRTLSRDRIRPFNDSRFKI